MKLVEYTCTILTKREVFYILKNYQALKEYTGVRGG